MTLKQELRKMRSPSMGMRRFEYQSHIIIFTEKESDNAEFFMCFPEEVEKMFDYLQPKVWAVRVIELGREVSNYYEQEFAAL